MASSNSSKNSSSRKPPFYWKLCHDIWLLKEVDKIRPWLLPHGQKNSQGWLPISEVLNGMGVDCDSIAMQKRYTTLCDAWGTDQWAGFRKSGQEEEYSTRYVLLCNLICDMKEFEASEEEHKEKEKKKKEDQLRVGKALQQQCLETLGMKRRSTKPLDDSTSSQDFEEGLDLVPPIDFLSGSTKKAKTEAMRRKRKKECCNQEMRNLHSNS